MSAPLAHLPSPSSPYPPQVPKTYPNGDRIVCERNEKGERHGVGTYFSAKGQAKVTWWDEGKDVGKGTKWSADRKTAWAYKLGGDLKKITLAKAKERAESLGLTVLAGVEEGEVAGGEAMTSAAGSAAESGSQAADNLEGGEAVDQPEGGGVDEMVVDADGELGDVRREGEKGGEEDGMAMDADGERGGVRGEGVEGGGDDEEGEEGGDDEGGVAGGAVGEEVGEESELAGGAINGATGGAGEVQSGAIDGAAGSGDGERVATADGDDQEPPARPANPAALGSTAEEVAGEEDGGEGLSSHPSTPHPSPSPSPSPPPSP